MILLQTVMIPDHDTSGHIRTDPDRSGHLSPFLIGCLVRSRSRPKLMSDWSIVSVENQSEYCRVFSCTGRRALQKSTLLYRKERHNYQSNLLQVKFFPLVNFFLSFNSFIYNLYQQLLEACGWASRVFAELDSVIQQLSLAYKPYKLAYGQLE